MHKFKFEIFFINFIFSGRKSDHAFVMNIDSQGFKTCNQNIYSKIIFEPIDKMRIGDILASKIILMKRIFFVEYFRFIEIFFADDFDASATSASDGLQNERL